MSRRVLIAVWLAVATVTTVLFPVAARASGCSAACVVINATAPVRPVTHFASGITDSVLGSQPSVVNDLAQLNVSMYRSDPGATRSGTLNWTNWQLADSRGAQTTLILQDLWFQEHKPGYPPTPWSNWAAYEYWVARTVTNIKLSGQKVNYWEVYNEPGWPGQYSATDFKNETVGELLQQFLVTYQIIKAILPNASVVGPGAGLFLTTPAPASAANHTPDINRFLDFAVKNNIKLGAFAIHMNGLDPGLVANMVLQSRAAIARRPALGRVPVYVDEYANTTNQPIPGWQVAYLSALEYSGASLAAGSCWWGNCFLSNLDSSLVNNGHDHASNWYVNRTYAQMTGQISAVSSTSRAFVALASAQTRTRTVVALIGRAQGCAVLFWCQHQWYDRTAKPVPPRDIQVTVDLPWVGAAAVHLSYEAFQPNTAVRAATPARPSGLTIRRLSKTSEAVTFTITNFADGAAYNLVVSG